MTVALTEGPLGFPLTDRQCRAVEGIVKGLPHDGSHDYCRVVKANIVSEVNDGERSDVSWISTESPDKDKEVILCRGMNDSQFALNPVVTLNHRLYDTPVGRSLWRKRIKSDGNTAGIKAKTMYPAKPESWSDKEPWIPDRIFALIQAKLLNGKSIGFLPLRHHAPSPAEVKEHPDWVQIRRVVDEWLLLEYAVCPFGVNPDTLVEEVSKMGPGAEVVFKALDLAAVFTLPTPVAPPSGSPVEDLIPFTPLAEIEKAIDRRLAALDWSNIVQKEIQKGLDKARGRI